VYQDYKNIALFSGRKVVIGNDRECSGVIKNKRSKTEYRSIPSTVDPVDNNNFFLIVRDAKFFIVAVSSGYYHLLF